MEKENLNPIVQITPELKVNRDTITRAERRGDFTFVYRKKDPRPMRIKDPERKLWDRL